MTIYRHDIPLTCYVCVSDCYEDEHKNGRRLRDTDMQTVTTAPEHRVTSGRDDFVEMTTRTAERRDGAGDTRVLFR